MKKSTLLLFGLAVTCIFLLTSYESGPASHSGWDCSGSESDFSNPVGCSTSNNSCHGTSPTAGIVVTIEVDAPGGTPVTNYRPDSTYTVKLTGTNTTSNSEPYFGFQMTAITGASRVVTPTNAGTWQQTGLPSGVQYSPAQSGSYLANVIEHNTALPAASGTGGAGTVYTVSVRWTAPAAGTGTVSFWAALNAVDGLDLASGLIDFWNTQSLVLGEQDSATATAVSATSNKMGVNIYPNPASDFVQIELNNAIPGLYKVNAYDAKGREVAANTLQATGSFAKTTITTSGWAAGVYLLQLSNGNDEKVVRFIKR